MGDREHLLHKAEFGFILKLFNRLLKLVSADKKDPALDHRKQHSRKREQLIQRLQ